MTFDDLEKKNVAFDRLRKQFQKLRLSRRQRDELIHLVARYQKAGYSKEGIVEAVKRELEGKIDWEKVLDLVVKYLPVIVQLILALL
jgi:hypothetical protein